MHMSGKNFENLLIFQQDNRNMKERLFFKFRYLLNWGKASSKIQKYLFQNFHKRLHAHLVFPE